MTLPQPRQTNPLITAFRERRSGVLLYGLTPPKSRESPEKIEEISRRRVERLRSAPVDGILLYDIQDEPGRSGSDRPFPFLPTLEPVAYRRDYLGDLALPAVHYQCVGKYDPHTLRQRLAGLEGECVVFVGGASRHGAGKCGLEEAYALSRAYPEACVGGVTLPERHVKRGDEPERLLARQAQGAAFFVSQFIFDLEKAKNLASDYYYRCRRAGAEQAMAPLVFTFTPCGSAETLRLIEWLGVSVPPWVRNEILQGPEVSAPDGGVLPSALELSLDFCVEALRDIARFCLAKGIPFGCNIESVSIRKDEVLASFELVRRADEALRALGVR